MNNRKMINKYNNNNIKIIKEEMPWTQIKKP